MDPLGLEKQDEKKEAERNRAMEKAIEEKQKEGNPVFHIGPSINRAGGNTRPEAMYREGAMKPGEGVWMAFQEIKDPKTGKGTGNYGWDEATAEQYAKLNLESYSKTLFDKGASGMTTQTLNKIFGVSGGMTDAGIDQWASETQEGQAGGGVGGQMLRDIASLESLVKVGLGVVIGGTVKGAKAKMRGSKGVTPAPGTRVRPEGIPKGWRIRPTKSKGGVEYYNPKNPNQSVRVMQGNPKSPYPNSQKPYVRQRDSSGSYLDAQGNRGVNKSSETHIPLKDFKFKQE